MPMARSAARPLVELSRGQWRSLIRELGRRGEGRRESGAFLLAPLPESRRVARVEYFDDLDPGCLRGDIRFDGRHFGKLWDICEARGLTVIADVHTHPRRSVAQSAIDQANPMIASAGHVALIVPDYASHRVRPRDVGVHQYRGNGQWSAWLGREAARRLLLRWWR